jgi:target of rapamycin complex 2 subunit MAPKAP1
MSEVPETQSSALDYKTAYKVCLVSSCFRELILTIPQKYVIYRKMPMLVTRQERTLAIDGVYIHVRTNSVKFRSHTYWSPLQIMPSANKAKAVFDNGKTSSYHIKSIAGCQQSTKSSSIFKLVVNRDAGNKRYDFEAESPKLASRCISPLLFLLIQNLSDIDEIVQTIRSLKAAVERSNTVNKSRRSRQVV